MNHGYVSSARHRGALRTRIETEARRASKAPARDQPIKINSRERRWSARLVGALESCAEVQGFDSDNRLRDDLPGRFKADEVRNRPSSRSAAKRAMLEMVVNSRVMV
jgi:hypothetical protein